MNLEEAKGVPAAAMMYRVRIQADLLEHIAVCRADVSECRLCELVRLKIYHEAMYFAARYDAASVEMRIKGPPLKVTLRSAWFTLRRRLAKYGICEKPVFMMKPNPELERLKTKLQEGPLSEDEAVHLSRLETMEAMERVLVDYVNSA